MSYTNFAEGLHAGEGLVSKANGDRSFDQAIIAAGADLTPCTVVGQMLFGVETSAAGANTGNGVLGAVALSAPVVPGVFTVRITQAAAGAGNFEVIDPEGEVQGLGSVGVAFLGGGLAFTLASGATSFVAGDSFTITVAPGSGKYVQLAPAALDGSQIAAGILWDNAFAATADTPAAIVTRDAEWNLAQVTWPTGVTPQQIATATAQLAQRGIILRV